MRREGQWIRTRRNDRSRGAIGGWLLFVLFLLSALNLADRQGMAAVAPAIKRDLALSDTQLGLILGLGFAIFFLLALPVARLAEHRNRTKIIAAAAGVFGVALALCSRAGGFWQFLLVRIGVGSGESGLGPPVASLIGDHYPKEKRASATTLIWLGAPVGAVSGAVLGGWFAQYAGWRAWFVAISVPAVAVALLAYCSSPCATRHAACPTTLSLPEPHRR